MKSRFKRMAAVSALVVGGGVVALAAAPTVSAESIGCTATGGGQITFANCSYMRYEGGGGDYFRAGETVYCSGIGFVNYYGPYRYYASQQSQTPAAPLSCSVTSRFNQHS